MAELSVVSVVLIVAIGCVMFIILFLLAKRQIRRFTLRSARKPHAAIGSSAPKSLRTEIGRRLNHVRNIKWEPVLWTERIQLQAANTPNHYHYRMKALDAFTNAVECLSASYEDMAARTPTQSMEHYLFELCPSAVAPAETSSSIIIQFSRAYDHARHDPAEFGYKQFTNYMELLDQIIRLIKLNLENSISQPSMDTEVILQTGKRGQSDISIRVQQTGKTRQKSSKLSLQTSQSDPTPNRQFRQRSKANAADTTTESLPLADSGLSSGCSSGGRSSSSRESGEKLLRLSHSEEREDSV